MDIRERAIKVTKLLSDIVMEQGGTSSHIAACEVVLPASSFDALVLCCELSAGLTPQAGQVESATLYGVRFRRGATEAQIRDHAHRNGLNRSTGSAAPEGS